VSSEAMALKLTSAAFSHRGDIPVEYTCDGQDRSPALSWSAAPAGTRSFLLVCDDPDAPFGVFHHWAVFDIPGDWTRLEADAGGEDGDLGFRQALNDFGTPGYGGPCPPRGDKAHRYRFRLSALDVAVLAVGKSARCAAVARQAQPHILETVELIGLYRRVG
jgi:Raf kinase inhibitor-like YbhB/YbcL family protein